METKVTKNPELIGFPKVLNAHFSMNGLNYMNGYKPFNVKIVKSTSPKSWYKNYVGNITQVIDKYPDFYVCIENNIDDIEFLIRKTDVTPICDVYFKS